MAYVKHNWKTGDIVSSANLNEMEDGIFNSQEKITDSAKLSADLISEGTTNKLVSAEEKTAWNSKANVSIPTESTSTNEAKFINVNGTDYKLATGTGKIWNEATLTVPEIRTLSYGGEIVRDLDEEYDATNFKNDYFVCKVDQTTYSGASTIWYGEDMQKVYINVDGLATIIPYFTNTVINQIREAGFDHNYYRTIALYAACDHQEGKEAIRSIDGKDIIYIQDVSQQKWEYNYDDEKEAGKIKREELDKDVMGKAVVFSIRGKGGSANPNCAFLYCLQSSQAAYWYNDPETPENSRIKWANIEAGKAYPVSFDGSGEGQHETLRWLLDNIQTVGDKIYGVEMLAGAEAGTDVKTKNWYLKTGIEFSLDSEEGAEQKYGSKYRICAAAVVDRTNNIFAECFGVNIRALSNVFSFNSRFGEANTVKMDYIGRPACYIIDNYAYTKETEPGVYVTKVERNGYHLWTCEVEGVTVQLVIPDNCDEAGVPHRNEYIMAIDQSTALSTNSIYRHTITVKSPNILPVGAYELNLSLCAVNAEAGDTDADYLLHSDESYQYADWILPVSGTVGRVIGQAPKAETIKPTSEISRITLNADYPAVEFEKLWDSLNKQATAVVGPAEEPTAIQQSYYLFAWETEDTNTHAIRIYKDLLATGDTTYFFEIDGAVNYKVTTTGDARWWKKNGDDWNFMTGENRIFDNDDFVTGIEQMAVGANIIYVGWDNVVLYQLLSSAVVIEGESAFGTMNQVARTHQAVRMRAGWQTIEDKDIRTLFIDYIDMTGEWNSIPAITDENKWRYDVMDFRSEVLAVKTPMTRYKAAVAVAAE